MINIDNEIKKLLSRIEKAERIVISGHINPDGDSTASQLALALGLNSIGKSVEIWSETDVHETFNFLRGSEFWKKPLKNPDYEIDMIILVDSADVSRLDKWVEKWLDSSVCIVNIDHHISNLLYANINIVDPKASSCGEIIYDIFNRMSVPLTQALNECLYVSILTDTGGFRYRNTTPKTHAILAHLLESDIPVEEIYNRIYGNISLRSAKLFSMALDSVHLSNDDRVAMMAIDNSMFIKTGTNSSDIDGFIDYLRMISGIEIAVLFVETVKDQEVKIGFRSNRETLDVNKLAEKFGGGGHPTASGARIMGTLNDAKNKVLEGISNQFYQNNHDFTTMNKQSVNPHKKQNPTSSNSEIYS